MNAFIAVYALDDSGDFTCRYCISAPFWVLPEAVAAYIRDN